MKELHRLDANVLEIDNPAGVPARLFANDQVPVDRSAVEELLHLLELQRTVERIADRHPDFFAVDDPGIAEVAVTPDFHKGAGIPIGTVLRTRGFVSPQAPGKDVNCGMCLYATDLTADRVRSRLPEIERRVRHVFFEGGRAIPMTRRQREALLLRGLPGLLETHADTRGEGLWSLYEADHQERELDRLDRRGALPAETVFGLDDFLGRDGISYDSQIGSIGGGNHFVEVQTVDDVFDGATAHAWGLKPGRVVVMIHTGSVSIGHLTGVHFSHVVREIFPTDLAHPDNGIFVLPDSERHRRAWRAFWSSFANAANFAFANRLFLGLMMHRVLLDAVGTTAFELVYGAGHNLIWDEGDGRHYLHRKGACPARGPEQMADTPFAGYGEPVIIPGSMGAQSFVLAGNGHRASLESASHGAGRALSRGDALRHSDELFREFQERFKVITPVDPTRADLRGRRDILRKWEDSLKKEAPYAYKHIGPVIDTQVDAGIARKVVSLEPLFTVKG